MNSPIVVVNKQGHTITLEQWQKLYELEVGSDQIAKHFKASESRFAKDIQMYGSLVVNEPLMRVLDAFRDILKSPVTINSFNRSDEHQKELKEKGFKAATFSPHVARMAADIDTKSPEQCRAFSHMLKRASVDLGINIRMGFEEYIKAGQTFVHVDVCPEYYAKGKPFHSQPHPVQWERVITW